jgi:hypothetical protein
MAENVDTANALAILREIAAGCSQVSHLAGMASDKAGDSAAVDTLNNAIQVMALRMGWLADVAAERLGDPNALIGCDALDWMMPAVAKSREVQP